MSLTVAGTGSGDPRPPMLQGSTREFSSEDLGWIAGQFRIGSLKEIEPFRDRGNINLHTYLVQSTTDEFFLLQRLNTDIFNKPLRVMSAMQEWIDAQKMYLASGKAPDWTVWEPMSLVPTRTGDTFLDISDATGWSVWRMMSLIGDTVTYKSLSEIKDQATRLAVAEEVGRGMALSADLTSPMATDNLIPSLPGYRDTRGYYRQFHSVVQGNRTLEEAAHHLPDDSEVREATQTLYITHLSPEAFSERLNDPELQPFVRLLKEREETAYRIFNAIESGAIRKTAIHGDTKIENFLFCRHTGKVRSLVDLDTIMPFTWLADWGDMMRSLCNVAGEKEQDLSKVQVDRDVYAAVTRGFLGTAKEVWPAEVEMMTDAVQIITLELGLRFLTDYLRGDNYFLLGSNDPHDLNKTRAMVQLTLWQRLLDCEDWSRDFIRDINKR